MLSKEVEEKMESKTVNGETNYETEDNEIHITHAEVNPESHEPVALKRNVVNENVTNDSIESDVLKNDIEVEDQKNEEHIEQEKVSHSETTPETVAQTDVDDSIGQTSETFMKIEENNVIERLKRMIDTELTLETTKTEIPDEKPTETTDEPEVEREVIIEESDANATDSKVEEEVEEAERVDETPLESSILSTDDSIGKVVLKSDNSIPETQENNIENEVRLHSFEENSVENKNHIEESEPRVVSEQLIEPEVVKHNGVKVDENQNEDEEEDEFKEIIGFKTTLKMWSSGKNTPNQSDDQPINSRDKFKTLRQIRKGNTRSLMEKFQFNK